MPQPEVSPPRIPYALTAYSMPVVMGFIGRPAGGMSDWATAPGSEAGRPNAIQFMDWAAELGVSGVELPAPMIADHSVMEVREALTSRSLKLVVDTPGLLQRPVQELFADIKLASACGARVVRAIMSSLLCGDRREMAGGFRAHLDRVAAALQEALPAAADLGVSIAVENHQDAATEDFFYLAERLGHHPAFGITLDTGNPLAVGQDPVEAARELAPLIRHLHLKDYTMHFAPGGYRLVRCAAGAGVVDFPEILRAAGSAPDLLPGIEVGAQQTRTIPFLEPDWWACHQPRDVSTLLGPLRLLWARGIAADVPYSSAWERGESQEAIKEEEWRLVRESVSYFRQLGRVADS